MALDESIKEDEKYTVNEIDMLIGEDVVPYTEGSQLDFIDDHRGQGFVLGPVDGGSCCGGAEDSNCGDNCCSN